MLHQQSVCFSLEQYQISFNYFQQQLAVAREIKSLQEEGQALGSLGSFHIFQGDYRRGIKYCQQALVIANSRWCLH